MPLAIATPLPMTVEQRDALEHMARSSVLPHRKVVQARALLLAGDGVANEVIARECATTPYRVRRWRGRFERDGVVPASGGRPTTSAPSPTSGYLRR